MITKEDIRENIPRNKIVRKLLSNYRVKQIDGWMLNEEEIVSGEKDEKRRKDIIIKCSKNKRIKIIGQQADEIISLKIDHSKRSNLNELKEDMIFCSLAYGFKPLEYYVFGLENKSPEERKQYVSDLVRTRYHCIWNDLADASIFKNKYKTYQRFKSYFKREAICIKREGDFDSFEVFSKKHPIFVKKLVYESLGKSVELIDTTGKDLKIIFQRIINEGTAIIEEKIIQSEEMSKINSSSVNTVRYVTILTKNGIEVPVCFLRIGQKGSFVDNAGAGGIAACIDKKTGMIFTNGYDESGHVYELHPNTGTMFKGYLIPEWESMRAICTEMAEKTPSVKYIGWDMAHTNNGWVVVEGNAGCQIVAQQMILGGLKSNMDELLSKSNTMI